MNLGVVDGRVIALLLQLSQALEEALPVKAVGHLDVGVELVFGDLQQQVAVDAAGEEGLGVFREFGDPLDPREDVVDRPEGHLLRQVVGNVLAEGSEGFGGQFRGGVVGAGGDFLQGGDGADFLEDFVFARFALDRRFHGEVEGGEGLRLFVRRVEQREEAPEPAFRLAVLVDAVRGGKLPRIVLVDERLDQRQRPRLLHRRVVLFVRRQSANGQTRVVLGYVVGGEGQREQPDENGREKEYV